ncbi:hypothetical protein SSAG_01729 [Streptomyces sp. Mg1]|nr:hypothetical protein SSAG_01729 [Streptomyces sp. Mg1]
MPGMQAGRCRTSGTGAVRGLPAALEADGAPGWCKEALTNVVKHAGALAGVGPGWSTGARELTVTVTDDGRGPGIPAGGAPGRRRAGTG